MLKLSPDEAALLKAVRADRNNDLPRLVYADYLDDHGRPERAELIRLQCEHERLHPDRVRLTHRGHMLRIERRERIEQLLRAHGRGWLRELPKWAVEGWTPVWTGGEPFRRGFIESFDPSASAFVRNGPQLLDRMPVRCLRLFYARAVWDEVIRCNWLREVPEIDLRVAELSDDELVRLASAEWLVGTQSLGLRGNSARDAGARALADCRHLCNLRHLDLASNELTLAGVRALAGSPYLATLETLDLCWNAHLNHARYEVRRLFAGRLRLTLEADD